MRDFGGAGSAWAGVEGDGGGAHLVTRKAVQRLIVPIVRRIVRIQPRAPFVTILAQVHNENFNPLGDRDRASDPSVLHFQADKKFVTGELRAFPGSRNLEAYPEPGPEPGNPHFLTWTKPVTRNSRPGQSIPEEPGPLPVHGTNMSDVTLYKCKTQ